jgi:hypothetical protein
MGRPESTAENKLSAIIDVTHQPAKDDMSELQTDTEAEVAAVETTDGLLCNLDLPLKAIYYPRGFTIELSTSSHEVLAAAEESWGQFHQVFSHPPLQIRIGVMSGESDECPPVPVVRGWLNLVSCVADPNNSSVCDTTRGHAFGWFTRAAIEHRAYFRYYFLEAMAGSLLTLKYLTPIHGACVKLAGKTVALCGDSGAGKSSLSFACARRGWTFLSDDAISLVRGREDHLVVGNPHSMRFRQAAVELFPELKRHRVAPRATGNLAIEVATASMPDIATELTSSVDYIVFLNRERSGPPVLESFSRETAFAWFEQINGYGEKKTREDQAASLRQLLTVPVYELCYRDLEWAVSRLEALVRDGA